MAGDWIKMRGELWTHPKFIALSNMLIYGEEEGKNIGMLTYACGWDALGLDVFPPSDESVTDKALRGVTKRALRDVTMCALLRVWCAVNSHCKVSGSDAICSPMNLSDLDEIAGFDNFGEALAIVGWVVCDDLSDSLIFPNFIEYNEPAILRKKPAKSNAERQAEYRQRNAEKKSVTKSNESNAREEKRRDISTSLRSVDKPKQKRRTKTQLPDDFTPCETAIQTLKAAGISVQTELDKFRDHAKANGKLQLDWHATFRTWARNAVDWAKPKQAPPQRAMTAVERQIDMANAMFGDLTNGRRRTIDVSPDGAEGDRPPVLVAGNCLR
jgi:hypothetical protein